jgi:ribosome silencing factor RsfS/YbeB/iojap
MTAPRKPAPRRRAAPKGPRPKTTRAAQGGNAAKGSGPVKRARPAKAKAAAAPQRGALPPALPVVQAALADMKAVDVRGANDVADFMVVASGTSDRHLRAIADRVVQMCKASGQRPLGVEGEGQGEWVLVDLPDVMVHVMLPRTREFYQLEQLWEPTRAAPRRPSPAGA